MLAARGTEVNRKGQRENFCEKSGWWIKAVQAVLEGQNVIRGDKTSPIMLFRS